MNWKRLGCLFECVVVTVLAIVAPLLTIYSIFGAFGEKRIGKMGPLLTLAVVGIAYLVWLVLLQVVCLARNRKRLIVRTIVAGGLGFIIYFISAQCYFEPIVIPAMIASGEGGIMRRVGYAVSASDVGEARYVVYSGEAKYGSGSMIRDLVLLSCTGSKAHRNWPDADMLVGYDRILLPNGFDYIRIPCGLLPMRCCGGIDITSGKVCNDVSLSIENRDGNRVYSCTYDGIGKSGSKWFRLEIPLECFGRISARNEARE